MLNHRLGFADAAIPAMAGPLVGLLMWLGIFLLLWALFFAALLLQRVGRLMTALLELTLSPVQESDPIVLQSSAVTSRCDNWARRHGFEHAGYFTRAREMLLFGWKEGAAETYLVVTVRGQTCKHAFISICEKDAVFCTSPGEYEHILPLPLGTYTQAFPGLELDALFQRHHEGLRYLARYGLRARASIDEPFEVFLTKRLRSLAEHCRAMPFWRYRLLWWYFVRRGRWHHVGIREQHERGWIRTPGGH